MGHLEITTVISNLKKRFRRKTCFYIILNQCIVWYCGIIMATWAWLILSNQCSIFVGNACWLVICRYICSGEDRYILYAPNNTCLTCDLVIGQTKPFMLYLKWLSNIISVVFYQIVSIAERDCIHYCRLY